MKQFKLTFLLTMLMSMVGAKAFAYDIAVGNFYYNYINDGKELEVTYGSESKATYGGRVDLVIPEEVNYMGRTRKVTRIGDRAYYWLSGFKSISIPKSVTSIGEAAFYAFYEDGGLTSVNISDLEAWCKITFKGFYSNPLS